MPEPSTPEPAGPEPSTSEPGPTTGRRRLQRALERPYSRGQLVVGVLLAVVGFAAVVQVQSHGRDDRYVGARQGELVQLINNLSLATQRAEDEIETLRQTRDSLLTDSRAQQTALARASKQADALAILAGTVPATGPGLRITVSDPRNGVGTNQLLNGLEELRTAGAEAIELNDTVRVVAQTSLRDNSNGKVVADGTVLKAPYVLDVIGNPDTLATALRFRGGFTFVIEEVGGSVRVHRSDRIVVASVRPPPTPGYAEPGGGG